MRGKYYISFVEECIQNPLYKDYIGGRIEVYEAGEPFATREIRFFTRSVRKFRAFRDHWDLKNVTKKMLKGIEAEIADRFCKFPKNRRAV